MPKTEKDRKRELRRRKWEASERSFTEMHKKGPHIKLIMQHRGYRFPFYDYFDSYVLEFEKVVAKAKAEFKSLYDVIEVDDGTYYSDDPLQLVPAGWRQIIWDLDDEAVGYGTHKDGSNLNGFTSAFLTESGQLKTLVVIRKSVPSDDPHREFKYAIKLTALLHELGHVLDMEQETNIQHAEKKADIIEAEVFAHLYALERMAKQNYYQSYGLLTSGLKNCLKKNDYGREVARRVFERMPQYELVDTTSISLGEPTPEELVLLGPIGRRVLCGGE